MLSWTSKKHVTKRNIWIGRRADAFFGTVEHSVVPIGSNWVVDVFRNRWWHGRTGTCVCHCYLSNVGLPKDMVLLLLGVWLLHGLYNSNRAIIRPWMAKQPNNPRKALGWSQMTTDSSRQFPNPSPCHFNPTCHRSTPGFRRIRDSGDWCEEFLGFDPERPANSQKKCQCNFAILWEKSWMNWWNPHLSWMHDAKMLILVGNGGSFGRDPSWKRPRRVVAEKQGFPVVVYIEMDSVGSCWQLDTWITWSCMLHMEVVVLRCFVDLCGKYGARVDDCEQNARSVALGKPSECRDDIRNISRCYGGVRTTNPKRWTADKKWYFRKISRWKPRPGIAASGGSKMAATLGTGLFGRGGGEAAPHPATNKQSISVIFCSLCILYFHERAKHVSTVLFFVIFTNFPSAHLWLKLVTFYLTIIAFRLWLCRGW